MASQEKQNPEMKFRAGKMSVAVWSEEVPAKDGKTYRQFRFQIQKRYYDDKDKQWKSTESLHVDDIPRLILIASKAFEYAALKQFEDPENGTPF